MRPENIEKWIKDTDIDTNAGMDKLVLDDVLRALEQSKEQTAVKQPSIWRIIIKSKITKLATAAMIIIAVLIGINHFGDSIDMAGTAFGDVLEQIHKATSVTYKQTFKTEGRTFTNEEMIIQTGHMRSVRPYGIIIIWDWSAGKRLQLTPELKKATLTYYVGRSRSKQLFSHLDWVSRLHEDSGEYKGQEELDGQIVDVFVIEVPFEKTTVWVDPETNLPVRIEMTLTPNPDKNIIAPRMVLSERDFGKEIEIYTNDEGVRMARSGTTKAISISSGRGSGKGIHRKMTIIMHDFNWNVNLDESLFSLEPPEGYTVEETQSDHSQADEQTLIHALSFWTEMSDGFFPSEINDLADPNKIKPLLIKKFDKDGEPVDELNKAMKEMYKILKGLYFAQEKKTDDNWNYTGNGIRLGDIDEPICWWKAEDSDNYRVVYGDLSIGNVSVEDLPRVVE